MVIVVLVELCVKLERRVSVKNMGEKRAEGLLTRSRTETSIILWLKYAVLFFTTLTATTSCVFKFWHFTTCPKVPWPRTSRMR
jgi:hypothetical protein